MARTLAVALLSFCLFGPSLSYGLGLGAITLNSALGHPLDAEIELLQVRDLTPAEILPGLGSREDFEKAGVERNFFLSGLRFRVVFNDDTNIITNIHSKHHYQIHIQM